MDKGALPEMPNEERFAPETDGDPQTKYEDTGVHPRYDLGVEATEQDAPASSGQPIRTNDQ